jgi:hypothetical protein
LHTQHHISNNNSRLIENLYDKVRISNGDNNLNNGTDQMFTKNEFAMMNFRILFILQLERFSILDASSLTGKSK